MNDTRQIDKTKNKQSRSKERHNYLFLVAGWPASSGKCHRFLTNSQAQVSRGVNRSRYRSQMRQSGAR